MLNQEKLWRKLWPQSKCHELLRQLMVAPT